MHTLSKFKTQILCFALSFVFLLGYSTVSIGHELSTAHLKLETQSETLFQGRYSLSLADLQTELSLDPNNDGKLHWRELNSQKLKILQFLQSRFTVFKSPDQLQSIKPTVNGQMPRSYCKIQFQNEFQLNKIYGEIKFEAPITINCKNVKGPYTLRYISLSDAIVDHKLVISLSNMSVASDDNSDAFADQDFSQYYVDQQRPEVELSIDPSAIRLFQLYVYQGFIHILIGFDHILFLLCLLLPFGMKTSKHRSNVWYLVACVTGFTIGHSITLALGLLGYSPTSPAMIEVLIATSVGLTAVNVITQWVRTIFAFSLLFGLLHGYGFAGVLSELGLPQQAKLYGFLGFNLGIEAGQFLIMAAILPVLYLIRTTLTKSDVLMKILAFAILCRSLWWVWERIAAI